MRKNLIRILASCARVVVVVGVLLAVTSVAVPTASAAVKPATLPAACTLSTINNMHFAAAWTGELDGQAYDAIMTDSFAYSSGPSGTMTGTLTYALAGSQGSGPLSGTYVVANSGTYCGYTLNVSSPLSLTFEMTYLPDRHQMVMIETDASGTMEATEWKTSSSSCSSFPPLSSGTPSNSFVGAWQGTLSGQAYSALSASDFGALTSGSGAYSGELTYNIAGSTSGPGSITGTYTFTASSCSGTISAEGLTFSFVVIPTIYPPSGGTSAPVILLAQTDGTGIMGVAQVLQY